MAFNLINKIKWVKKAFVNNFIVRIFKLFSFLSMFFLFKFFIIEPFKVPSSSMEDTIQIGDIIIVDKLFSKLISLNNGDIIVFKNINKEYFVKRCIGKAGDLIKINNGEILINNKL